MPRKKYSPSLKSAHINMCMYKKSLISWFLILRSILWFYINTSRTVSIHTSANTFSEVPNQCCADSRLLTSYINKRDNDYIPQFGARD